jgi:hypothetical protein
MIAGVWVLLLTPCLSVHGPSLDHARARYVLRARLDRPDYHLGAYEHHLHRTRLDGSNCCCSTPQHRHSTASVRRSDGLEHIHRRTSS